MMSVMSVMMMITVIKSSSNMLVRTNSINEKYYLLDNICVYKALITHTHTHTRIHTYYYYY